MIKRFSQCVYSHNRDIQMEVFKDIIRYKIPMYSEKEHLGNFSRIYTKNHELIVEYSVKEDISDTNLKGDRPLK